MRIQDRVSKGLEKILKKMCEMVNCDYESFNFDNPQWFWNMNGLKNKKKNLKNG